MFDEIEVAADQVIIARMLGTVPLEAGVVVAMHVQLPNKGDESPVIHFYWLAIKIENARQNDPAGFQYAVAQIGDIRHHRLIEKTVAHLFVEDDVHRLLNSELSAV